MYPDHDDDPPTTQFIAPVTTETPPETRRIGRRGRIAITTGAAVALIAAGTGLGLALGGSGDDHQTQGVAATTGAAVNTPSPAPDGNAKPGKAERVAWAWAHQYGQDRSALSNLPEVAAATPEQRAAATDLLTRTEAATAAYADVSAAKAAGFDVQGTVAKVEQRNQKLAQRLSQADATGDVARLPLLPVPNGANLHDHKTLDPTAPEALLYAYQGHDTWKLVGAAFSADEAYPQAPPDPGGPITRWSFGKRGGSALTMRVFFVPGNDLAHAYAMMQGA
jgi:hypothetical protein